MSVFFNFTAKMFLGGVIYVTPLEEQESLIRRVGLGDLDMAVVVPLGTSPARSYHLEKRGFLGTQYNYGMIIFKGWTPEENLAVGIQSEGAQEGLRVKVDLEGTSKIYITFSKLELEASAIQPATQ